MFNAARTKRSARTSRVAMTYMVALGASPMNACAYKVYGSIGRKPYERVCV
jgi:hypothetical protein